MTGETEQIELPFPIVPSFRKEALIIGLSFCIIAFTENRDRTAKPAACLMADAGFAGAEGPKGMERGSTEDGITAHPDSSFERKAGK